MVLQLASIHRAPTGLVVSAGRLSSQNSCFFSRQPKQAQANRSKFVLASMNSVKVTAIEKSTNAFLGEQISMMGLGLAALGRPGYINLGHDSDLTGKSVEEMRHHSYTVLDAAWEAGVRYFDAARSYGKSEDFLSGWLASRDIHPNSVVVGSKWGYYYTADWQVDTGGQPHEVKEHTYPNLVKQTKETDGFLGQYLNLYQIHSATLESGVLGNKEVLQELARLKKEKGWKIGLTVSSTQQPEMIRMAIKAITPAGERLFDTVQATFNLLEQSAGPALLEAKNAGMDIIVKEAMANGRLTARNTSPAATRKVRALSDMAAMLGTSADALALACVIAQPFTPMVLSGAACVDHLQSNAAALTVAKQLDADVLTQLMEACVTEPKEYWDERSALAWN